MTDETLGPWVRRFLLEHVVAERNLARNTQHGYRDALRQIILFVAKQSRKSPSWTGRSSWPATARSRLPVA